MNTTLIYDQDKALSLQIDDSGCKAMEFFRARFLAASSAMLRVAAQRGDHAGDPPDTFEDAVFGAEILARLAQGVDEAILGRGIEPQR